MDSIEIGLESAYKNLANETKEDINYFTEDTLNKFMECPNPISLSDLRWLMEQDWFKNSDE